MGQLILKQEVLDKIKKDGELFIKVSKAVGVSHFTLPALIYKNDPKLTQYSVLQVLRQELEIKNDNDLLTEKQIEKAVA